MALTAKGTRLLSGGEDGVICEWQAGYHDNDDGGTVLPEEQEPTR